MEPKHVYQSFHANPISNALESCLVVSSFDKIILATSLACGYIRYVVGLDKDKNKVWALEFKRSAPELRSHIIGLVQLLLYHYIVGLGSSSFELGKGKDCVC